MNKHIKNVTKFLGINKRISGLLVMVILIGLGEKLAERFLPIYLTALGASLLIPGLLNGLDVLLSSLYSIPGGWLTARYGYKRSLLWFNIMAMAGYLIVIVFPHWIAVIIGSFFFLSWTSLSLPAAMDLIKKEVSDNKQVMGVSLHSLMRRIPMALGPVIGGVLIDQYGVTSGIRISFMVALVLGMISAVIQQYSFRSVAISADKVMAFITPSKFPAGLKTLLVSDILIRFSEQMPYAYIAIWAIESKGGAGVTATQFGILTAVEMLVAFLVYIPVAYFADRSRKKPFVTVSFIFFTLFPMMLWISVNFLMLLIAFIIRGLKEFGEPTRKSLIMDLSPADQKVVYFGSYYFYRDIVVTISAVIGAFLWKNISPVSVFLTSTLFGLSGLIIFVIWGRESADITKNSNIDYNSSGAQA